jgi:PAS domain S-box-containing protein
VKDKYIRLYDFAPSGYFTLSVKGEIIELNISGARMLGKDRQHLKNNLFGFFVSEETKPIFNRFLEKAFQSSAKESCDVTLLQDGNLPMYGNLTGIVYENGEQCLVTMVDITERKQDQESLRQSELLYRNLFDKANEGLILLSMEGKLVEVNNSFAEMHGYTVDELKDIDIKELDVLNDRAFKGRAEVMQRINAGEVVRFEVEHYHKDGHIVTLSTTASLINVGGQQFYLAFHQDISERRVAQEALQSSEKRYRTTLESISDAFFSLNNQLRFTYFNKQAEELLLQKSSDVLGKQIFSEVFKEAKGSVFEEKYIHALTAKEVSTFETFFGIEPYINWYDVRVYPGTEGIAVFFTVITEKKKADTALRLSLLKYQTLFDLFPAGITISDSNGQIIETNSIAQHILGLDAEEQKQRHVDGKEWQIIRPDGSPLPPSEYASVRALDEQCQIANVEMGILKGNDQVTWINVSATPIPIEGYGVAIVYNDITAQKQTEKRIRLLNETLEQRVAERTNQLVVMNKELEFHLSELEQFSYVSNHDLQEPLRTLTQFTQLFTKKYADKLDEEGKKYVEFITKAAMRMKMLVKDLLEYSLLGKESEKSIVDCNKIVDIVLGDLDESIKGSSAKLTVQELPILNVYETEFRMLFQNLIENAIKYQKKDMIPEIIISAESLEKEWLFSIKDNGIGIDKKHDEKIFIIFQRLHNRAEYEGTGIGLAHCKKIVEMHGGRIWVESTPEKGSIFMFTIPK